MEFELLFRPNVVAHVRLVLLQLLLVLLGRQVYGLERRSEFRGRAIFALCELVLFFDAMRRLFVFFALHLHKYLDLLANVVDDSDAGQFSQLFALQLKSFGFVQVDLNVGYLGCHLPRPESGLSLAGRGR